MTKAKHAELFHEFALEHGATHAITISPDLHGLSRAEAERAFRRELRDIQTVIAQRLGQVSRRQRAVLTADHVPFTMLVLEDRSRFGSEHRGLHAHGAVSLRASQWGEGAEPRYRAALRQSWGRDEDPDQRAYYDRGLVREEVPNAKRSCPSSMTAAKRAPSFCLRPIRSEGWIRYAMKHWSEEGTIWFTSDLFL